MSQAKREEKIVKAYLTALGVALIFIGVFLYLIIAELEKIRHNREAITKPPISSVTTE